MTADVCHILSGVRARRLAEAAEIAILSRMIARAKADGRDFSRLLELRDIHKTAHMKFHAKEVEMVRTVERNGRYVYDREMASELRAAE